MEQYKNIKTCLMSQLQSQMGDLKRVDAKELGEVVDMIKDLEEAMYYCTVTKAMEESKKEEKYYTPRDMDYNSGRLYYSGTGGGQGSANSAGSMRNYMSGTYPMTVHDYREGRSPMSRKNYMEAKEMNKDTKVKMEELEKYAHELTDDVMEMVKDATHEEKVMLKQKLTTLAGKLG